MSMSDQANDDETISNWLCGYLADRLHVRRDDVPVDTHFVDLGMSSREMVTMTADLESFVGKGAGPGIDPATIFEYPTITALAHHLGSPGSGASKPEANAAAWPGDAALPG